VVIKQDGAGCIRDVGVPEEERLENKVALFVSEPRECLKT